MIDSASREDTAKLFTQGKVYRSIGGLRPLLDFTSEKGKKYWAGKITTSEDATIRPFDSYDIRQLLFRMSTSYTTPPIANPHQFDNAFADIAMSKTILDAG